MKYLLLFLLFFEYSSSATLSSPFHLSYGGAGVGSLEEGFSHILNPAAIGFHRRSKSALAWSVKQKEQMTSLVFTDLKTGVPLSINYERYWTSRFVKSDLDRINVSMGAAITSFLAFGITIRRDTFKKGKEKEEVLWNGDLGALVKLSPQTGIGITLNQVLINDKFKTRITNIGLYQKIIKTFSTRVDMSYSQTDKWIAKGALESLFRKFLAIRVGGSWDFQLKESVYGVGLSFYGPRLQFDYSLEKDGVVFQHALIFKLLI